MRRDLLRRAIYSPLIESVAKNSVQRGATSVIVWPPIAPAHFSLDPQFAFVSGIKRLSCSASTATFTSIQITEILFRSFTHLIYGHERVAVISAKNHKRQRRKRQSVTAKREKSQTPKSLTAILTLTNLS